MVYQQDEVEVTLTEVLGVLFHKKGLFFGVLAAVLSVGLLVGFLIVKPSSKMELSYQVPAMKQSNITYLAQIMVNPESFRSFASSMNLSPSQFFVKDKEAKGKPFYVAKGEVLKKEVASDNDVLDFRFYVSGGNFNADDFVKNLERHVINPGFITYTQASLVLEKIAQLEDQKKNIINLFDHLTEALRVDSNLVRGISGKQNLAISGKPIMSEPMGVETKSTVVNVVLQEDQKPDWGFNFQGELRNSLPKAFDYKNRFYLSVAQQRQLISGIIRDNNQTLEYARRRIGEVSESIVLLREVLNQLPLNQENLAKLYERANNFPANIREDLLFFFQNRLQQPLSYHLITPNSKVEKRYTKRVQVLVGSLVSALILALLVVFLSDFWDKNRSHIIENRD